jgi:serine/threonine protein phosphatase PrpC
MDELLLTPAGAAEIKRIAETFRGTANFDEERFDQGNLTQYTGCTAVVVLVTPEHIYCANAGDSRAVLARTQEASQQLEAFGLSEDHKPDNLGEKKRIVAAGGFVEDNRVNGSLNLSRSLGDFEFKSNTDKNYKEQMVTCFPEITKTERSNRDRFLILACDGIWDCL